MEYAAPFACSRALTEATSYFEYFAWEGSTAISSTSCDSASNISHHAHSASQFISEFGANRDF